MPVTLAINGQSTQADPNLSLFDQAEAMGIDVPTSCLKQGKCKECMVEVAEGMDALSPATEAERHLKGNFRLSCQTFVTAESGLVRCHTMRRGHMRIEHEAFGMSERALPLDPAVVAGGAAVPGLPVGLAGVPVCAAYSVSTAALSPEESVDTIL